MDRGCLNRIVSLLVPYMDTPATRQAIMQTAWYGSPLLHQVNWTGNPRTFTTLAVTRADTFGEIDEGVPAVLALLEGLRPQVGYDVQKEIDAIISDCFEQSTDVLSEPPQLPSPNNEASDDYIFISYSSADRAAFVDRLANDLTDKDYELWVDNLGPRYNGITAGKAWQQELADALNKSALVVFVITPDSIRSKWCLAELNRAAEQDTPIVPVLARPIDHDDRELMSQIQIGTQTLNDMQYRDFVSLRYERGLKILLDDIEKHLNSSIDETVAKEDESSQIRSQSKKDSNKHSIISTFTKNDFPRGCWRWLRKDASTIQAATAIVGVIFMAVSAVVGVLNLIQDDISSTPTNIPTNATSLTETMTQPLITTNALLSTNTATLPLSSPKPETTQSSLPSVTTPDSERIIVPGGIYSLAGQPITIDTFKIDRTEVSRDNFAPFFSQATYNRDAIQRLDRNFLVEPNLPMTRVSYQEASDYCDWVGGHLPTEEEWLVAAAWTETNTLDISLPRRANIDGILQGPRVVTDFSDFPPNELGLHDIVGNVSEWATSLSGTPLQMGGDFRNLIDETTTLPMITVRIQDADPDLRAAGIRCIYDQN